LRTGPGNLRRRNLKESFDRLAAKLFDQLVDRKPALLNQFDHRPQPLADAPKELGQMSSPAFL
jgi:hypothetical protein